MTALERLADQLESDADQLRIRMGRGWPNGRATPATPVRRG